MDFFSIYHLYFGPFFSYLWQPVPYTRVLFVFLWINNKRIFKNVIEGIFMTIDYHWCIPFFPWDSTEKWDEMTQPVFAQTQEDHPYHITSYQNWGNEPETSWCTTWCQQQLSCIIEVFLTHHSISVFRFVCICACCIKNKGAE